MQLLKLVYIAHGWHLALLEKPLVPDYALAWDHGPVFPSIYFAFRPQGIDITQEFELAVQEPIAPSSMSIIEQTYAQYGEMSAQSLSALTHIAGGPWDQARKAGGKWSKISNESIRDHYLDKIRRANELEMAV